MIENVTDRNLFESGTTICALDNCCFLSSLLGWGDTLVMPARHLLCNQVTQYPSHNG